MKFVGRDMQTTEARRWWHCLNDKYKQYTQHDLRHIRSSMLDVVDQMLRIGPHAIQGGKRCSLNTVL